MLCIGRVSLHVISNSTVRSDRKSPPRPFAEPFPACTWIVTARPVPLVHCLCSDALSRHIPPKVHFCRPPTILQFPASPQVCEQLQAELAAKQAELDTSKATILSLLEGGAPKLDAPPEHAAHSAQPGGGLLGAATSGRPTDLFVRPPPETHSVIHRGDLHPCLHCRPCPAVNL